MVVNAKARAGGLVEFAGLDLMRFSAIIDGFEGGGMCFYKALA